MSLRNFRNYEDFSLSFDKRGCIVVGKNGVGKSNLLEGLSYFAFGKSILQNYDNDLIRLNCKDFSINSEFEINNSVNNFFVNYNKEKKIVKYNDKNIMKLSQLYKLLHIIYSSPDDLNNIYSIPGKRRYFLDLSISKVYPNYIFSLKRYKDVLSQRNTMLKKDYSYKEKEAWDESLCKEAYDVVEYRKRFIQEFSHTVKTEYNRVINSDENIDVEMKFSFDCFDNYIINMKNSLIKNYEKEKKYKETLIGPHRDDFIINLDGLNSFNFASQGQKRSIVIAFKLAIAEIIKKNNLIFPILIFDDTLADLDVERCYNLLTNLSRKHQLFSATPDDHKYSYLSIEKRYLGGLNE
jgi:DNA replication and repair protein RecF